MLSQLSHPYIVRHYDSFIGAHHWVLCHVVLVMPGSGLVACVQQQIDLLAYITDNEDKLNILMEYASRGTLNDVVKARARLLTCPSKVHGGQGLRA